MTDIILETKDVKKWFGEGSSKTEVLKGISIGFKRKSLSAILGASGAGKSTLLHVLSSLERPDSGDVLFEGKSLKDLNDQKLSDFRNQSVGFVFQFHHLMPEFTALENAAIPLLMRGEKKTKALDRARMYLAALGVEHRLEHRPSEMSGGEQQRVAVARALVNEPQVLFADEPTGNLDHANSQKLIELLLKIYQERDLALIMVTHNPEVAKNFSQIIQLDDGRVSEVAGSLLK